MERNQYETVTSKESFALLIPASAKEAIGEATFQMELGTSLPVRAVTLEELKKAGKKLKGAEGDHFFALLALRGALEARDELMLANAKQRLERVYNLREAKSSSLQTPEDEESRRSFAKIIAGFVGLPPLESLKHFEGLRPGPRAKEDPHKLLSYEVSQSVNFLNTQIVLWWVEGTFRPAIYCLDTKTALYIHTFLIAPTGGIGFRICPHCTEQFFQDRPNQDYCCPAHREAHRVARWRDEQKRKRSAAGTGKTGKKNGTHKTR